MIESWKVVKGWGRYQVSNLGNVKGVKGQLLKPQITKRDGRRIVQLSPGRTTKYVARLVLEAFEGHKPGFEVDHKDRDKLNDRLDNLRWATRSENGLNKDPRWNSSSGGIKGVTWSTPRCKWVAQISKGGKHKTLGYFNTIDEASKAVQKFKGSCNAKYVQRR